MGGNVETIASGAAGNITGEIVDFAQLQAGGNFLGLTIGATLTEGRDMALEARIVNNRLRIS